MDDKLIIIVADGETLVGRFTINFISQTSVVQALELGSSIICCQINAEYDFVIVRDLISLQYLIALLDFIC